VAGAAVLAACGGGSDAPAPVVVVNPLAGPLAADLAGGESLLKFQQSLQAQPAAASDSAEPFELIGLTLPTSETAEPLDV
jgi:hypothetical protein